MAPEITPDTQNKKSNTTPTPDNSHKKVPVKAIVVAAVSAIAVLAIVFAVIIPRVKYSEAQVAFDEGNYTLAEQLFSETHYKDAPSKAALCRGMTFLANGNYQDAIDTIEKLTDKTQESKACYEKACYLRANELFEDKEYEEAAGYYQKAKSYKDSKTRLAEAKQLALQQKTEDEWGNFVDDAYDAAYSIMETLWEELPDVEGYYDDNLDDLSYTFTVSDPTGNLFEAWDSNDQSVKEAIRSITDGMDGLSRDFQAIGRDHGLNGITCTVLLESNDTVLYKSINGKSQ